MSIASFNSILVRLKVSLKEADLTWERFNSILVRLKACYIVQFGNICYVSIPYWFD